MQKIALILVSACMVACAPSGDVDEKEAVASSSSIAPSFDGADYANSNEKVAHGERLSKMLSCDGCHGADYTGADFGAMFPVVEGLWATNISLALQDLSDAELERLLREGVHPKREI